MNSLYIACTAVLLLQCISIAISCASPSCSCQCDKDPPLKLIFQIVEHFKEVQGCGRKFTTSHSVSDDGVRLISYHAELRQNESSTELCDCIHGYLSQKDWLDGSTKSCCVKKNIATMTIEGEPDPAFDNISTDNPLEQLERIFAQFKYGEFQNHHCRKSTTEDEDGKIHFYVECDLRPDSPSKEELCTGIEQYLNQDSWLGELTSTSKIDGNVLYMELTAKDG
ncbi:uncharacterized protein LOC119070677 [Bradysia coprophila]|uniref:uncharacterized protein LOC119070677 n=1 Tax=Bradysia coprophila TaxID=38358 RepID=UPI00187D9819|nr:uncharacterized protein LOC119070677 [Bradysia coprophila]XP_037031012.1 uncharacterized protein LOC119070677 [Bradysia coprophila]XP_037031014.1 uncharacterized protein LOC119070677 [Bradysia coprophila]